MSASTSTGQQGAFSAEERAAMKERAKEAKGGRGKAKADPEADCLAKIAEMEGTDRVLAEGIHALVKANAPHLIAKTWYGMPAYAQPGKSGKLICFFQPAAKFKARYATLGFDGAAALDDGTMWPTAFALTELTPDTEARIAALVKQAAG
ncbi:iron chaperone [Streptomyces sp. NPDC057694]|uniref:iron chaperone n=1 Tax=Streptomyces sp. NPDC057694 TaxID=3346216 RepID=UPI0036C26884